MINGKESGLVMQFLLSGSAHGVGAEDALVA